MKLFKAFHLALAALALGLAPGFALAGKSDDTLVWATHWELESIDPYYVQTRANIIMTHNVCDSLLYRDPNTFEYKPLLASAYTWVDDVTMDFELRKDATFHNGKPFKAEDVVYTFNHVADPDSGVLTATNVNWIKSAEARGEYVVRVHLKKRFPAALDFLSGATPILPKGHYDAAPEQGGKKVYAAVNPVCVGPYKLADIVPGESVTLEADPNYFGGPKGKASIKTLKYRTIGDQETRTAELLTGGIDWTYNIPRDLAGQLDQSGQVSVAEGSTTRIGYIHFDAAGKGGTHPFTNLKVRQAVNHAIDRMAIAKNFVGESARPVYVACFPKQFGCMEEVQEYRYDPAKAKSLLAEAGYPNGFQTTLVGYRDRSHAEAIVGFLKAVGIKAELKMMQNAAMRPLYRSGAEPFIFATWGSYGIMDASASVSHFFKGAADDGAQDQEVIAWLSTADSSTDPKVRKDNYTKALKKIAQQAYWVPLYTYAMFYAFNKELDFPVHADAIARFYLAEWK